MTDRLTTIIIGLESVVVHLREAIQELKDLRGEAA